MYVYLDSSTTIIMEVYADCGCRTNVVVFVDRYCCAILFVDCVFWDVDLLCYCKCCILEHLMLIMQPKQSITYIIFFIEVRGIV